MPSEASSEEVVRAPAGPPLTHVEGKLHPATILMALLNQRWLIVPFIAIVSFGGFPMLYLWPLFGIAAVQFIFQGVVRYMTFSYRLDGGELVIRDGIFERTERHIPVERIQDLQIERNIAQRALGVAVVRVQTATGGDEPEATLSVLGLDEVERLRRALAERAAARSQRRDEALEGDEEAREVIRTLGIREIVVAGLTSSILGPFFILLGSMWGFADDLMPDVSDWLYRDAAKFLWSEAQRVAAGDTTLLVAFAIAAGMVAFGVGLVASAAWHVALFYGFTLSRVGENLERRYGLLTRRSISLPRRRIQVLVVQQSLLRRIAGLASFRADVAGGGNNEDGNADKGGRDVMLPFVRLSEAESLLPAFFPDLVEGEPAWTRVSRRAIRRWTTKGVLASLLLTIAALVAYGPPWGLLPLLLAPLAYWVSVAAYRNLGYSLGDAFLRTRRGWIGRSMHVVPIRNVQATMLRQTPFDVRHGLATVLVDTAGQTFTGGGPAIPHLPLDDARALAAEIAHRASRAR